MYIDIYKLATINSPAVPNEQNSFFHLVLVEPEIIKIKTSVLSCLAGRSVESFADAFFSNASFATHVFPNFRTTSAIGNVCFFNCLKMFRTNAAT